MLLWKDVMHTMPTYLPKESSLLAALRSFTEQESRLLFIQDCSSKIVGYLDQEALLKQILAVQDLHQPIKWKEAFCVVSAFAPLSYPQPYDVFLARADDGGIVGYATSQDIRIRLEQQQHSRCPTIQEDLQEMQTLPDEHEGLSSDGTELPHQLVYRSAVMQQLVDELKHIAKVGSTVLLMGESGVGKEVFAKALHHFSDRREEPFIRVNCGAIPANLLESELFGYEKGAFTGADQKGKPGLFELANRGTIFLDEIADLPYSMQVKLLRVLQEREIMRIGGIRTIPVDIRVVAATNQDIRTLVRARKFREDLYYRLHVVPIEIPPLRKRKADIVPLAMHFLHQYNRAYRLGKKLSSEAFDVLQQYEWPGNVRELQNVMERSIVTARGEHITADQLWANLYGHAYQHQEAEKKAMVQEIIPLKEAVEQVESQLISLAMKKYGTAAKVAKILGVSPATVSRRMQKHLQ
ncbi:sigma-54 interaction domain-containing protein [Brevibacillus migulae]|uniref:sigma-54 interaction domain-containing protein n=1 Tax=Brevibacillus migulae TaxID=1644114 RepID=UPI00106E6BFB|nr:sigma 54-interacting transcriptional regulator [Brevibacillus migulae]